MAEAFMFVGIIIMIIGVILLGIMVAYYVLYSLSLYNMAKKYDIPTPGLAWVPYASYWTLGSIADKIMLRGGKKTRSALILVIGHGVYFAVSLVLSFAASFLMAPIMMVGSETSIIILTVSIYFVLWAMAIALYVFAYIAYYRIYKDYTDSAPGWLVLSIFVPFAIPFIFFSMAKKQSRSEQFVSYSAPQDDNSFYNQ